MSIEVIIPTKNRPSDLTVALDSVLQQTVLPAKVAIIDSGTERIDIDAFERKFNAKNIRFKHISSSSGLTYQRNVGIKQIECPFVLFLDDDVILDPLYIAEIFKPFELDYQKLIGGLTGQITNLGSLSFFSVLFRRLFFMAYPSAGQVLLSGAACGIDYPKYKNNIQVGWLSGCNMFYRREVFEEILFDETLVKYSYCEDLDFSFRVGKKYQLWYVPNAKLKHVVSKIERLSFPNRYAMFVRNHHYLFTKNMPQRFTSLLVHWISMKGIVLQALLLERSWGGFKGAFASYINALFVKK